MKRNIFKCFICFRKSDIQPDLLGETAGIHKQNLDSIMFQCFQTASTRMAVMCCMCVFFTVCEGLLTQPITKFDASPTLYVNKCQDRSHSTFSRYGKNIKYGSGSITQHATRSTVEREAVSLPRSVEAEDSVICADASDIELHLDHIRTLQRDGYVVVPNFLPQNFVNALRVVDFSRSLLLQTQNQTDASCRH
jgi:hypothetical protein